MHKFNKNLMLRIRLRQLSGTYLDITASVIGIWPNTKDMAIIIKKNRATSEKEADRNTKITCPTATYNNTCLAETLSISQPTATWANEATA